MRNVKNFTIFVLVLALVSTAAGATRYVNTDGSGGAYTSIQTAIDEAVSGEDQIEVAPGTYYEAINFKGKAIRLYSADGRDATTINATGLVSSVVTCNSDEGADTMLDGFTITGGNGVRGGGMYNFNSSPTVTNCIFSSNTSDGRGGGMCNYGYDNPTNPTVTNCNFIDNSGHYGGGMDNTNSSPTVTNCNFIENTGYTGGGMLNEFYSDSIVTNCTFISNTSGGRGAGMMNFYQSSPTVTNCNFSKNWVVYTGGGMSNEQNSNSIVTNCTFSDNTAGSYGGMHNEASNPTVTNCILWGDTPDEIADTLSAASIVTYSDVQGGWTGTGNINADPMFADALNGDYRLLAGSPCIDTGNDAAVPPGVTTDLDGNPRIQGACVDMGAFEAPPVTPEAMLANLRAYIVEQVGLGNIDAEMETSLLSKVDAAIAALARDNPNDAKVAMNDLKALVNQVEAQTDKKITPETAAEIIQRANAIIAVLGG
jgi:hypothetical protein